MIPRFRNAKKLFSLYLTTSCLLISGTGSFNGISAETTMITNQPPSHVGWEVSQDVRLPARSSDSRIFKVEFTFMATASNNVQIAFGKDVNNDGKLPAEETSATVGWDCGRWFLQSGDLRTVFTNTPSGGEAMSRTLRMSVRLNADGEAIALSFKDQAGSALTFGGLGGVPTWVNPKEWNMAALTARGWGERGETAQISFILDGTHILLR
jgi:hypothetical protein